MIQGICITVLKKYISVYMTWFRIPLMCQNMAKILNSYSKWTKKESELSIYAIKPTNDLIWKMTRFQITVIIVVYFLTPWLKGYYHSEIRNNRPWWRDNRTGTRQVTPKTMIRTNTGHLYFHIQNIKLKIFKPKSLSLCCCFFFLSKLNISSNINWKM